MTCLLVKLCGIPEGQFQGVCDALAEHGKGMARHFEVSSGERILLDAGGRGGERLYTIAIKIRPQHLTSLIKVAKQFRVSEDFGSIDVFEVRCTTELPPDPGKALAAANCWSRCRRRWKQFNSTALDRMSTLEIHSAIVAHSFLSFNHLACIIIASAMAGIGLITDSSLFVLAAFFVSPLMQMVLATVWGLTVSDFVLAWRGCRNMLLGAATCLLYGAMFGAVLGSFDSERDLVSPVGEDQGATSYISINTLQISSRGPPRGNVLMSGIIAGLSGVAIGLGQGSGIGSALIGVCISTSLLPPLVNAGMMWALQLYFPEMHNRAGFMLSEIGEFSVYLYLVNIACIVAFAWASFKFKHIGGRTLRPLPVAASESEIDPAQIPELLQSLNGV